MDSGELTIAVLGVICAIGLPVLLAIIVSYTLIKSKHQEKMAMIEKGIVFEERDMSGRKPSRYNSLRNGVLMIGLSLGLIVGMVLDTYIDSDSDWGFFLVPGITVLFGGAAFVAYFFLSRRLELKEQEEDEKSLRLTE